MWWRKEGPDLAHDAKRLLGCGFPPPAPQLVPPNHPPSAACLFVYHPSRRVPRTSVPCTCESAFETMLEQLHSCSVLLSHLQPLEYGQDSENMNKY